MCLCSHQCLKCVHNVFQMSQQTIGHYIGDAGHEYLLVAVKVMHHFEIYDVADLWRVRSLPHIHANAWCIANE